MMNDRARVSWAFKRRKIVYRGSIEDPPAQGDSRIVERNTYGQNTQKFQTKKSAIENGTVLKRVMNGGIPNEWKTKNRNVLKKKGTRRTMTSKKTSPIL